MQCKDSARRGQNKKNLFFFYVEPQPIFAARQRSARRGQNKKNIEFFCLQLLDVQSECALTVSLVFNRPIGREI